jgi:hypothetical protein
MVDMEDGIHSPLLHVGAGGVYPGGEGNLGGLLIGSNMPIGSEPLCGNMFDGDLLILSQTIVKLGRDSRLAP